MALSDRLVEMPVKLQPSTVVLRRQLVPGRLLLDGVYAFPVDVGPERNATTQDILHFSILSHQPGRRLLLHQNVLVAVVLDHAFAAQRDS